MCSECEMVQTTMDELGMQTASALSAIKKIIQEIEQMAEKGECEAIIRTTKETYILLNDYMEE